MEPVAVIQFVMKQKDGMKWGMYVKTFIIAASVQFLAPSVIAQQVQSADSTQLGLINFTQYLYLIS